MSEPRVITREQIRVGQHIELVWSDPEGNDSRTSFWVGGLDTQGNPYPGSDPEEAYSTEDQTIYLLTDAPEEFIPCAWCESVALGMAHQFEDEVHASCGRHGFSFVPDLDLIERLLADRDASIKAAYSRGWTEGINEVLHTAVNFSDPSTTKGGPGIIDLDTLTGLAEKAASFQNGAIL